MGKTYIITGATGFIGSAIAKRLLTKGANLILIIRGTKIDVTKKIEKILTDLEGDYKSKITTLNTDISSLHQFLTDTNFAGMPKTVDGIIHLAANLSFRSKDKKEVFNTNFSGTKQVVWLARRLDATLYQFSTAYVHGKRKGRLLEDELIETNFNNPYEESKFLTEKYLREEVKTGLSCIFLRPSIVIRKQIPKDFNSPFGYYSVVQSIYHLHKGLLTLSMRKPILAKIFGLKLEQSTSTLTSRYMPFLVTNTTMNLVPLSFVVETTMRVLDREIKATNGKTFHLSSPKPLSMHDISHTALTGVGINMRISIIHRLLVKTFFWLLNYISRIIKPLSGISKKFHYYGYYMVHSYNFDMTNTASLFTIAELDTLFKDQKQYLQEVTKQFIISLKSF